MDLFLKVLASNVFICLDASINILYVAEFGDGRSLIVFTSGVELIVEVNAEKLVEVIERVKKSNAQHVAATQGEFPGGLFLSRNRINPSPSENNGDTNSSS